ncbi:MAG: hypothetical protein ACXWTS_02925 [Methylococcaceae bacterium]
MEKNKLLSLKLIGFSEVETEQFSAVLDLAERGLQQSWRIVETVSADFFILAEGTEAEQINSLPYECCLFCTSEVSAGSENSLLIDSTKRVPRLRSLIELLNRAAILRIGQRSDEPAAKGKSIGVKKSTEPEFIQEDIEPDKLKSIGQVVEVFFNPEQGLLKYLLQTNSQPFSLALKSQTDNSDIYIHPSHKTYYCKTGLEQLSSSFSSEIEWLEKTISEAELDAAIKQTSLLPQPLSNLVWYVAFKSSQGRLMQGHSGHDIVYLTRLPDLGVPECRKFVKLATFMKKNAVPLDTAAIETNTSLAQVYDFYNACQLTGLIEKATETKIHQKDLNDEKQSLLARIGNRLKKPII